MSRFFSADFHLGFSALLDIERWPFKSISEHDSALMDECVSRVKENDIVIHVGDLASYGIDNHGGIGSAGLDVKPDELLRGVKGAFLNIKGNHDASNRVRSVCDSLRTSLGRKYQSVSVSHYPSYDRRCRSHVRSGDIHICGHVHGKWRHCLDLDRQCLNVNVGCMVWKFRLLSEAELVQYIGFLLKHRPDDLHRCKLSGDKLEFRGDPMKF